REIARRHELLLETQRPIALARRERLVGQRLAALVEGPHPETEHLLLARHQGQAPEIDGAILINDGIAPAASFVEVEVTAAYSDDLVGGIVGPLTGDRSEVDDSATVVDGIVPGVAIGERREAAG
ncbi:MAG: hypothetical protein R3244_14055, partial [Thermoanaerobaculia bacterium]|nr:hypothetical protein [Thermoanaerobaculia bacterium]